MFITVHVLIRGKGLRVLSGLGRSKILTHKRDAHIEAHFLRTVTFLCRLILGGGSGGTRLEGSVTGLPNSIFLTH